MNKLLLLIVLAFFNQHVVGQNTIGLPQIINYTKNDFRGGSQTWDIDQGENGQMFFANNEGLLSYDGKFWKNYPLPNKTILRSIAIGTNKLIYAGGQGEIGYYGPNPNGGLSYVSLLDLLPEKERNFADIWDIEMYGNSVFFRVSERKIFELRNNVISIYDPVSEWLFIKSVGGLLYAQDRTQGILRFKGNVWKPLVNAKQIGNDAIVGLVTQKDGSLTAYTYQNKTYTVRNDSIFPYYSSLKLPEGVNIFKATAIDKETLVLATTTSGCLFISKEGRLIQKISRQEGLQNNNALSIFLDRQNNIWTGLNNGISYIAYNAAVKLISPSKVNDVAGFTTSIYDNKLYIGSSEGAYSFPITTPEKDISFLKGDFQLVKNSFGQVWRFNEINQKLLMAHTNGCFTIKDNVAIQISKDPGWLFLPLNPVIPSKKIVAGTYMGLKMLEFENEIFKDLGNLKGLFESFRFLAIDNENRIWASHPYRGIYLLTLSENGTSYNSTLFTDKHGLPSTLDNHVFKIVNKIIFATSKGAYEFDEKSQRFIPSPFLSPYFKTMELRYMNEDEEGNIWFCSGKNIGVFNFNQKTKKLDIKPVYFPELKGQVLSGFENVYPFNSRNIFVASERGIVHINYEKYKQTKFKPNILLSLVRATGKSDSIIYAGTSLAVLPSEKSKAPVITLPSEYASFYFEYSSPAYVVQNNIEYSFMLEGYDKTWSSWTTKQEKEYTNLSGGKYTFKIKARDNLGNESDTIVYNLSITPPWYKTRSAYFVYTLLLIFFVAGLYKMQKFKIDVQRKKFKEEQEQLSILHQLEIEKNEKEIIKLKNEKLENDILLKAKELADTSMHLVERNEALLKVKDELQKFYKKTDGNHDIKKTLLLLRDIEKNNTNWDKFAGHFDEVSNDFIKKIKSKFPKLTKTDLKICTYLQLNLSSKEIAQLMNVTVRGVEIHRYRLRKKLNLDTNQSLHTFLNEQIS